MLGVVLRASDVGSSVKSTWGWFAHVYSVLPRDIVVDSCGCCCECVGRVATVHAHSHARMCRPTIVVQALHSIAPHVYSFAL